MHPSDALCSELRAWQKNKHHIFTLTARVHCAILPKLCTVIELVEAIKKV